MSLFLHLSAEAGPVMLREETTTPPWPMFNVWTLFLRHPLSLSSVPSVKAMARNSSGHEHTKFGAWFYPDQLREVAYAL